MSLDMSVKRLTMPSANTSRGSERHELLRRAVSWVMSRFVLALEQREHAVLDRGHGHQSLDRFGSTDAEASRAQEHGPVQRILGQAAVAAAHELRIERDHVH